MDSLLWHLLDPLLAALVLGLGWAAVSARDLRRSVVHFIAFGLLLAIVWARLATPDLALAEAAIGAGLSGALLLGALRDEPETTDYADAIPGHVSIPVSLFCLALGALLAWVVWHTLGFADPVRMADRILDELPATGVSNPVTAVLLNFRAYDTLLELAVLLAAVLGILALGPARAAGSSPGVLFNGLLSWLVPLLILTAAYLLWAGAHAPGGAFQAGALLAAAAVMLRLGGFGDDKLSRPLLLRLVLTSGVAAFLTVGLATTIGGRAFLEYPQAWSGALIFFIETAAMLAIAATLALAYLGGRPARWEMPSAGDTARGHL